MKVLFIGDIFGNVGRRVLAERLPSLISEHNIDVSIGNGENAAGGRGLTGKLYKKLRKYGLQVVTGGNHSFSVPDNEYGFMDDPYVLRPLNYPPGNIGKGFTVFALPDGRNIGVLNLQGRTYLHQNIDCPFRAADEAVQKLRESTSIILVDFHGDATSEKIAFANYMDGKVSAVVGTHTHVQTADEKILAGGTAFISDAGMTGPEDSVIGMEKSAVIRRFLLQTAVRFQPSESGPILNGVIIDIDDNSGKALSIFRIYERIIFNE
ncbi:MAG TPA: TIGR00282 family metallophosphoesterase [Chitinispirillaceae bacterium]|nr:TIGR00282 family metallophosphoesterase [Chitinispirillaceae bacterium]